MIYDPMKDPVGVKAEAVFGGCPLAVDAVTSGGQESEDGRKEDKKDELWRTHEVSLLAKITNAIFVKDFRPIAVLAVIFKLYSRVLYMRGEAVCRNLVEPQFAFRKPHPANEVVVILRQRVEESVEWRATHIFLMGGDIKKAYDYASHKAFAESAREGAWTKL